MNNVNLIKNKSNYNGINNSSSKNNFSIKRKVYIKYN